MQQPTQLSVGPLVLPLRRHPSGPVVYDPDVRWKPLVAVLMAAAQRRPEALTNAVLACREYADQGVGVLHEADPDPRGIELYTERVGEAPEGKLATLVLSWATESVVVLPVADLKDGLAALTSLRAELGGHEPYLFRTDPASEQPGEPDRALIRELESSLSRLDGEPLPSEPRELLLDQLESAGLCTRELSEAKRAALSDLGAERLGEWYGAWLALDAYASGEARTRYNPGRGHPPLSVDLFRPGNNSGPEGVEPSAWTSWVEYLFRAASPLEGTHGASTVKDGGGVTLLQWRTERGVRVVWKVTHHG